MEELTSPEIDFVILADRAEAVNGRLYMMGGGFDRLHVATFEAPVEFSVALGVLVPWIAANEHHRLLVGIEHEDGRPVDKAIEIGLNVGRPPTAIPGQSFRATIAIQAAIKLPGPGGYCVSARVGDHSPRRTVFYATPVEIVGGLRAVPPKE
ncbi:MAG: hypothetical protein U0893_07255 [Chloroflexota bacterium]